MFASCAPDSGTARAADAAPVFTLASVYDAWRACRRGKCGTRDAQRYGIRALDHLVYTAQALSAHLWRPSRALAFVVRHPKAREVLAAGFGDRVVHHWLVPRLERLFEPVFIDASFSNRRGKGTHAAVDRLHAGLRQVTRNRHAPAWYLQLDISNFFNSIDRRRLYGQVRARIERDLRRPSHDPRAVTAAEAEALLWLTRRLLTGNAAAGAIVRATPAELAGVPPHKRLINAPPETGLPIGNLTSQFFANVYLNALDQFVKHELKCRHYVRYVDDFVLLHEDRRQLEIWRDAIAAFLRERLELTLRDEGTLREVSRGIDFLGYVTRPGVRLVRRRVVGHFQDRLHRFAARLAPASGRLDLEPALRERLRASVMSYQGHCAHAAHARLMARLELRFTWLADLFDTTTAGSLVARWAPARVASMRGQWRYFRRRFAGHLVLIQAGNRIEAHAEDAVRIAALPRHGGEPTARPGFGAGLAWPARRAATLCRRLSRAGVPWLRVAEDGWLRGGLRRRVLRALDHGAGPGATAHPARVPAARGMRGGAAAGRKPRDRRDNT